VVLSHLTLTMGAQAQTSAFSAHLAAQAIVAAMRVDPLPGGGPGDQVVVEQPVAMLRASDLGNHLEFVATLDFEGWTMPHGVLSLGGWGEGFNDRRHPHTYAHELMLTGTQRLAAGRLPVTASVSVGKGFAPFGSDDPMNRSAIMYPVNHHWSQILERGVLLAGVRVGPVTLEGALFNGDEPERPGQWPRISGRFGDSWSSRVTFVVGGRLELEGSFAKVKSPENRPGAATDQHKWHTSARLEQPVRSGRLYLLAEWARTSEADGFFVFHSALVEAAWRTGPHRAYYRFEHTDRPEEERTLDPFRSVRPHLENSILGVTRWSVHTVGYSIRAARLASHLRVEPIAEVGYARVSDRPGGLFDARSFYGRTTLWSATAALRLAIGMTHRMGRYGVSGNPIPMRGAMEMN
jgi:hypothetical protein